MTSFNARSSVSSWLFIPGYLFPASVAMVTAVTLSFTKGKLTVDTAHHQVLDLNIVIKTVFRSFAAITRFLDTTKGSHLC